ncbi:MAG: hypothetical protein HKO01_00660 [Flaviramulus sp.]|nr:hypothetical protein [Flaviramulus sp.]NNC49030.1 hypothetical protein [Flaviramulus sp.]
MIISPLFVFFLILVFALIWLFTNTIDDRKWLTFLISLALTPVVYFYLFYPMLNIFNNYHHQKYFDAEAWNEKPALRYEMSEQILNDSLFIRNNKAEIEALLGKAEWYGWDDSIKANSPEKWNYNLGFKPGAFNNLQECLEFEFKNDTVIRVKQYQLEQKFE